MSDTRLGLSFAKKSLRVTARWPALEVRYPERKGTIIGLVVPRFKNSKRSCVSHFLNLSVDQNDNELSMLDLIHMFLEAFEKYFGSVRELDLVFNFDNKY